MVEQVVGRHEKESCGLVELLEGEEVYTQWATEERRTKKKVVCVPLLFGTIKIFLTFRS